MLYAQLVVPLGYIGKIPTTIVAGFAKCCAKDAAMFCIRSAPPYDSVFDCCLELLDVAGGNQQEQVSRYLQVNR
jgi:hypothetical protein